MSRPFRVTHFKLYFCEERIVMRSIKVLSRPYTNIVAVEKSTTHKYLLQQVSSLFSSVLEQVKLAKSSYVCMHISNISAICPNSSIFCRPSADLVSVTCKCLVISIKPILIFQQKLLFSDPLSPKKSFKTCLSVCAFL